MRKLRIQIGTSLFAFMMGTTTPLGLAQNIYGKAIENGNISPRMESSTIQENIAITEENFPDPNFREWLRFASNINEYGVDGILTPYEISQIKEINVSNTGISSLKGIELFEALESLSVKNNSLTELHVTNNKNLTYLNCDMNTITSLDVSGLANLKALYCEGNTMTSLNLNGCTSLEMLYCRSNRLTDVDFSTNTQLKFIETFDNQLTKVDLSALKQLEFVHLDHNKMTYVDLSYNTNLTPIGSGFVIRNNFLDSFKVPIKSDLFIDPDVYAEQDPKIGYEKVEWYADQEFTQKIIEPVVANGQTFYAKWIPNQYTLHFDGNGGSGSMLSQKLEWDQNFILPENQFQRMGYLFDGWTSSRNSSTYVDKEEVNNLVSGKHDGEKVTLFAKWKPISYTISFDQNGGTGENMSSQHAIYNQSILLANCSYTPPEGKKFAGWSTNRNEKVQFFDGSTVQNLTTENETNVVLYAIWKEDVTNIKLQELETEFKQYNPSNYTIFDYERIKAIYVEAEEQLSNSSLEDAELINILTQAKNNMREVQTLSNRVDVIVNYWKINFQDVRDRMNSYHLNENNATDIYNRATKSLEFFCPETIKNQIPEIDNVADQELIATKSKEQVASTLKSMNDLVSAAIWVQTLNGLSTLPYSEVTSSCYGKYKEICMNMENYFLNLSQDLKNNLEYRKDFALKKQALLSELLKAYQGYDLSKYTIENQIKLKEIYQLGVRDIENGSSIEVLESVLINSENEFQKIPLKNETENNGSSDGNDSDNNGSSSGNSVGDNIHTGGTSIIVPPIIVPPANGTHTNEHIQNKENEASNRNSTTKPLKENETTKQPEGNTTKPIRQLQVKKDYQTKVTIKNHKIKVYFVFTGNYSGKSSITFTPSTKLGSKAITLNAKTDYTLKITEYTDKVQVKITLKGKYKGSYVQEYKKTTSKSKDKKTAKIKLTKITKTSKK